MEHSCTVRKFAPIIARGEFSAKGLAICPSPCCGVQLSGLTSSLQGASVTARESFRELKPVEMKEKPQVGVVGPCGAGKSPLVRLLKAHGVQAREIAQEHSGVPTMWARLTQPRYLVYLEVSQEVAAQRLDQGFTPGEWEALCSRLAHARQHADLVVDTDGLTPEEVASRCWSS